MIMVMLGVDDELVAFFANLGSGWAMPEGFISTEQMRNPALAQAVSAREQAIRGRQQQR